MIKMGMYRVTHHLESGGQTVYFFKTYRLNNGYYSKMFPIVCSKRECPIKVAFLHPITDNIFESFWDFSTFWKKMIATNPNELCTNGYFWDLAKL